jgi:hypothetical protein
MFKMNPLRVSIADLVFSTCRSCLPLLHPRVGLSVRVRPGDRLVTLDTRRVSQIIINALRWVRMSASRSAQRHVGVRECELHTRSFAHDRIHNRALRPSKICSFLAHSSRLPALLPLHSNAGKATTSGTIEVDVALLPDPSAPQAALLSVQDPAQADTRTQFAVITVKNPRVGQLLGDTEGLFIPFRDKVDTRGRSVRMGESQLPAVPLSSSSSSPSTLFHAPHPSGHASS